MSCSVLTAEAEDGHLLNLRVFLSISATSTILGWLYQVPCKVGSRAQPCEAQAHYTMFQYQSLHAARYGAPWEGDGC